jgi:hypothetical protein
VNSLYIHMNVIILMLSVYSSGEMRLHPNMNLQVLTVDSLELGSCNSVMPDMNLVDWFLCFSHI